MFKQLSLVLLLLASTFFSRFTCAGEVVVEDLEFQNVDALISASLYLPSSLSLHRKEPLKYAVVFVHGSGPQKRSAALASKFAEHGIAALVYDKRGVGRSGGDYESEQSVSGDNIALLARDASAAIDVLARRPELVNAKLGLTGISQAGWIVPLAARSNKNVDFMVLWSGPVCKVSEEDIYSKYTADKDANDVPSFSEALSARTRPYRWPGFLGRDTNSAEDLQSLSIPGFWVFGGQDGSIPVDLSVERLTTLQSQGHDYYFKIYPNLGHNNIPETFDDVVKWIGAL